ncbi:MAG: hypothetical protein K9N46_09260 [Candidatus Marinimicrobia bacterium]|nr:hypothetical protein [Candidatus Neomarinimicrobiota bacterium]MCF7829427.1 hypothetical protein [Candidatus Neomarinimicrobiota bacterium]MCF7880913.1 hypothetical protein [Candidatus Neomarinimicrobiota bacterium]
MNQTQKFTMIQYAILCALLNFAAHTVHAGEPLQTVTLPETNIGSLEFMLMAKAPIVQQSEVESGEPELTTKELQRRKSEYHRKRNIWLGSSIVSGAIGVYIRYSADKHYEAYKTSTGRASDLHRLIELEDTLYPIFYGISAACLLPALSYHFREMEITNQLKAVSDADGTMHYSLGAIFTW